MTEPINLNKARGRNKSEKAAAKLEAERVRRTHEGAKRED